MHNTSTLHQQKPRMSQIQSKKQSVRVLFRTESFKEKIQASDLYGRQAQSLIPFSLATLKEESNQGAVFMELPSSTFEIYMLGLEINRLGLSKKTTGICGASTLQEIKSLQHIEKLFGQIQAL